MGVRWGPPPPALISKPEPGALPHLSGEDTAARHGAGHPVHHRDGPHTAGHGRAGKAAGEGGGGGHRRGRSHAGVQAAGAQGTPDTKGCAVPSDGGETPQPAAVQLKLRPSKEMTPGQFAESVRGGVGEGPVFLA